MIKGASIDEKARKVREIQRAWMSTLVAQIQQREWFGTLTVVFKKGVIKTVRKDQSLIPPG